MMRIPYPMDHALIRRHIGMAYDLYVDDLVFLPKGDIGYCYIVNCSDGSKRFLKLQDDPVRIRQLEHYLPTTRSLWESGAFVRLSYPISSTRGALYTRLGDAAATLFNYIDGESLEDAYPFSDALRRSLARSMAQLHKATPLLRGPMIRECAVETFDVGVVEELYLTLAALGESHGGDGDSTDAHRRSDIEALSDIVKRYRPEIDDMAVKVDALRPESPQSLTEGAVICHGDLWGGNMMLDASGSLYIVDWESLVLAPRELEFLNYAGDGLMLDAYSEEMGCDIGLDMRLLGFFHCRRQLQNLVTWMKRILKSDSSHGQNLGDLDCIVNHCLVRWDLNYMRTKI